MYLYLDQLRNRYFHLFLHLLHQFLPRTGSVIPFSSEAVLVACVGPLGLDPWLCTLSATAGNVAGGMTCYWLGHLGKLDWLVRHKIVTQEKIDRFRPKADKYGAIFALLAWVPYIGEAISICLGILRIKALPVLIYMSIGKTLRYIIFVFSALGIIRLF